MPDYRSDERGAVAERRRPGPGGPVPRDPAVPLRRPADLLRARARRRAISLSLVVVYRGVMLYGDSGAGKSSLINAGLLPRRSQVGFQPERVRVQPRARRGARRRADRARRRGASTLPAVARSRPTTTRAADRALDGRVRASACGAACASRRPLLVFDQFEELVTLFEETGRRELAARGSSSCSSRCCATRPPGQAALRLPRGLPRAGSSSCSPPCPSSSTRRCGSRPPGADDAADDHPRAVRALSRALRARAHARAGRAPARAARASGSAPARSASPRCRPSACGSGSRDDPEALLDAKGRAGAARGLPRRGARRRSRRTLRVRRPIALLSQMVTSAGTRNVISRRRPDRARPGGGQGHPPRAARARRSSGSRASRSSSAASAAATSTSTRSRASSSSPGSAAAGAELVRDQDRRRLRRRLLMWGSAVGTVLAIVAAIAIWALVQRANAKEATNSAKWLAVASTANELAGSRLDESLLLSLAAVGSWGTRTGTNAAAARSAMVLALERAAESGATAILTGHSGAIFSVAFGSRWRAGSRAAAPTGRFACGTCASTVRSACPLPVTRASSIALRSARMDARWRAAAATGRFGSGMCPARDNRSSCWRTRATSTASRTAQMGKRWQAAAMTARFGSGT